MKEYKKLEMDILFLSEDIVTASVFVEWGNDWKGEDNQDNGWVGNIFG